MAPDRRHFLDLAVIVLYLIGVTWFGAKFRGGQKSLKDYFLGGQTAPWWAIALSIVSAETSTLTVVGTPALSFAGNFGFLQIVFGYLLGRILISILFLPQYFKGHLFTAYELMQRRFGSRIRKVTAAIFLVTRALAEGVRVFAVSIVISIILGTGEISSILLIVALTIFYTFEGGMTAVIWTDVVQMTMYVLGAGLSLFIILGQTSGGWSHAAAVAGAAGKFQLFNFSFNPATPYTFWAGLFGGCFLSMASHGTDQLVVQRLLSARTQGESRAALLASWVVIFVQFSLFLTIGVLLFVFYGDTHRVAPKPLDRLYPQFIWDNLPAGLAGLVIAAILAAAMANLSAALNSLASTTVMDFVRPMLDSRSDKGDLFYLRTARGATILWGALLVAIGIVAQHWGSVLESGLSIASVTFGMLLGVFLLAVLTRRVGETAAIAGLAVGLCAILYVKFATAIAFTWWVLIGSMTTFIAGYVSSFIFKPASGKTIHD